MNNSLDLFNCEPANYLWSDLIKSFGIEKATQLVRQALDLQNMQSKDGILPVLFVKTGGVALTSFELLEFQTGLKLNGKDKVLLYSQKDKVFQMLHEVKKMPH